MNNKQIIKKVQECRLILDGIGKGIQDPEDIELAIKKLDEIFEKKIVTNCSKVWQGNRNGKTRSFEG